MGKLAAPLAKASHSSPFAAQGPGLSPHWGEGSLPPLSPEGDVLIAATA